MNQRTCLISHCEAKVLLFATIASFAERIIIDNRPTLLIHTEKTCLGIISHREAIKYFYPTVLVYLFICSQCRFLQTCILPEAFPSIKTRQDVLQHLSAPISHQRVLILEIISADEWLPCLSPGLT